MTEDHHKLWGGRFAEPLAEDMAAFQNSFRFDRRLFQEDIDGSLAWATGLLGAGLINADEHSALVKGLEQVREEFMSGNFVPLPDDEDIHTAVERRLRDLVGTPALKLHTGRSRNDQVATDVRLYCLRAIDRLQHGLTGLLAALVEQAEQHAATLIPGYTHVQRAQPVTFGHWCLAYAEMLGRDYDRLSDARRRTAILSLGGGALAGHSLGVDRAVLLQSPALAQFETLSANSLDAVADRDFSAEILFDCAMTGIHISRLAEDLVYYSSAEYGFVELADAYSTGSSIMPQKKNPDSMELLRGKSGRLLGNLVTLMTVLKGLPLAYNKDMQEDKEPLFDSVDTLELGLRVAAAAIGTMQVKAERMNAALDDAMLATDLADELVRRGVPFREAHGMVGKTVRRAIELKCAMRDLPDADYAQIIPNYDPAIKACFDFKRSVEQKNSLGSTSPERVREQVALWRKRLSQG